MRWASRKPDRLLGTVLGTAAFYRLTPKLTKEVIDEVINVVADWKAVARRAKIAAANIELSASAFAALER